ncbi:MAG TPA: sigma 54-interacting transcriptional regulator [Myxococcales bacterium]|nr:sigma 54-interacting transcriptional regulator [Myxococcales bacterium]
MSLALRTISREIAPVAEGVAPHLFLVVVADRLELPSMRLSLRGAEGVSIGRGDLQRGVLPRAGDGQLSLTVPDNRMSVAHATLRRVMGSFILADAGSRNGTLLNGRRIEREVLADGDLIELGHSFFIFRSAIPWGDAALVYSDELRRAAPGFETLLPSLAHDFGRAEAVARSLVPVVIRGETGTGKEVVAAGLHALSGRSGRFVAVNCAALSPSLVQSQLLGHRKGAFSGATDDAEGLIRSADGGTLFLDAVEELPAAAQPLLSRVLEQAEVWPVGATQAVPVDIRVIAATQRDLELQVAEQHFRSDLLARLSGLTVEMPALRERREDLGLLIRTLLERHAGEGNRQLSFTCDAARALLLHGWPRNVRELEKALQAAVVLAPREPIGLRHLPASFGASQESSAPPSQVRNEGSSAEPRLPTAVKLQHFIDELWRRHVVRVLVAYAVALFGALQGADVIVTRLNLPPRWMTFIVAAGLAGFPVAGVLAWVFDWTRQGIVRTPPLSPAQQTTLLRGQHRRRRAVAFLVCILALIATIGVLWRRNHAVATRPDAPRAIRPSP